MDVVVDAGGGLGWMPWLTGLFRGTRLTGLDVTGVARVASARGAVSVV